MTLTNMMQILKALNNEVSNIYCETIQGDKFDQNILRLVLGEDEGYFEIVYSFFKFQNSKQTLFFLFSYICNL